MPATHKFLLAVLVPFLVCQTSPALGAPAKGVPGSNPRRPTLQDTIKTVSDYVRAGKFDAADSLSLALLARIDSMRTSDSTLVADVMDARVSLLLQTQQVGDSAGLAMATGVAALRERIQGADHEDVAESLTNLAWFHFLAGDYDASLEPARRSLTIREHATPPDTMGMSASLNLLASIQARQGDPAAARGQYLRALELTERKLGPEHPFVASILNNLAACLMTLGDYVAATPLIERSLAIRLKRLGPDHPEVGSSLNALGNTMLNIGDYPKARDYFLRALANADAAFGPGSPAAAYPINGLGIVAEETGDYATARTYYDRALSIRERTLGPDHQETGWVVMNIANLLQAAGDYAGATPLYERALRIAEEATTSESPDVAQVLDNMANNFDLAGDHAKAKPLYERALAIREKVLEPNSPEIARNLNNLGTLIFTQGDYAGAARLYTRALSIQERSLGGESHETAVSLELLGEVKGMLHENAAAESLLTRSIAVRAKILGPRHPQIARADWVLAQAEARLEKDSLALATALDAEEISRDHLRLTARSLSEDAALRYAAVRTSGLDVALSLLSGGRAGAFSGRAMDALIRSRALVLDELAFRRHASSANPDSETAALTTAYREARSRLAHVILSGPDPDHPERYLELLGEARRTSETAERALTGKSAELRAEQARDQVGLAAIDSALPESAALISFVRFTQLPVSAGRGRSRPAEPVPSYFAFIVRRGVSPELVPLGRTAEIDSLVGRWRREAAGGVFVRGRSQKAAERACRDAGLALRRAVWDRVTKRCGDAATVFVVPDGTLSLVNWSAMPGDHGGYLVEHGPLVHYLAAERDLVAPRPAAGQGMLAVGGPDFDSSPDSTGTSLLAAADRGSATAGYRGLRANCVAFRAVRFEALPGSAREAEEVSALWSRGTTPPPGASARGAGGAGRAVQLGGPQATERAVREMAHGIGVLHLATHGFFLSGDCVSALQGRRGIGALEPVDESDPPAVSGENPLKLCGLALAGANRRDQAKSGGDDGILTGEEISALDLSGVDWAVLSACDTGVGEVRAGEGVLGLRRAFQVAGARTVITSLWSVEDEATRHWMRALYSARFDRGLSTAASARAAARQAIQERRAAKASTHPFYWAAFVASGNWQ